MEQITKLKELQDLIDLNTIGEKDKLTTEFNSMVTYTNGDYDVPQQTFDNLQDLIEWCKEEMEEDKDKIDHITLFLQTTIWEDGCPETLGDCIIGYMENKYLASKE